MIPVIQKFKNVVFRQHFTKAVNVLVQVLHITFNV